MPLLYSISFPCDFIHLFFFFWGGGGGGGGGERGRMLENQPGRFLIINFSLILQIKIFNNSFKAENAFLKWSMDQSWKYNL